MSELREEAEALGIEVDGRWSDKRIQKEIEKVKAPAGGELPTEPTEPEIIDLVVKEQSEPEHVEISCGMAVRNARANLLDLKCVEIAGFEECELTAEQLADKRVQRALETGVLVEV